MYRTLAECSASKPHEPTAAEQQRETDEHWETVGNVPFLRVRVLESAQTGVRVEHLVAVAPAGFVLTGATAQKASGGPQGANYSTAQSMIVESVGEKASNRRDRALFPRLPVTTTTHIVHYDVARRRISELDVPSGHHIPLTQFHFFVTTTMMAR